MSKKTIVLADGSYTIRRIVELSFSEIDDVEVTSLENGQGLKEKLLSLKPDVVIADIKLSDLNGYEICRFVNSTEALKKARVYLLKGSFDPIDGEQIKNLHYQDIFTKPFDSNMLVSSVMKTIEEQPAQSVADAPGKELPGSIPEDLAEIETEEPAPVDISFSDIREEMHDRLETGNSLPRLPERDDVQPSEEITQGTQPMKDILAPEMEETFDNPFADDALNTVRKPAAEPVVIPPPPQQLPEIEFGKAAPELEESFDVGDKFPEFTSEEDTSEAAKKSILDAADFSDKEDEFPGEISVGTEDALKMADTFVTNAFPAVVPKPSVTFGAQPDKEFLQESHDGYRNRVEPEPVVTTGKSPLDQEISDFFAAPAKPVKTEPRKAVELPPELSLQEKSEMIGLIEDKLTVAIKELLWEIIPPLAEKIITEEIDRIKTDLKSSEG